MQPNKKSPLHLLCYVPLLMVAFISCVNKPATFLNNPSISNKEGKPRDSLTFYFPQAIAVDTGVEKTGLGAFSETWYSADLYCFKEPVLYNYYLGKDVYRFLWLRSFHRPVVFTFLKAGDAISLTTKILNHHPQFRDQSFMGHDKSEFKGKAIEVLGDGLIIVKADRKADIVYNKIQTLTIKEWHIFEGLLQKANFWNTAVIDSNRGDVDGSEWIFEAHSKDKYWFVDRFSPADKFKAVGVYLITLSGLKEEVY